jgi:hypothetical protein
VQDEVVVQSLHVARRHRRWKPASARILHHAGRPPGEMGAAAQVTFDVMRRRSWRRACVDELPQAAPAIRGPVRGGSAPLRRDRRETTIEVVGHRLHDLFGPRADLVRRRSLLRPLAPTVRPPAASGVSSHPGGPLTPGCGAVGGPPGHPWRPDCTLRRHGAAAGG